ncbi:recombinase family protein [Streptomyces sp. NPDC058989]|uniref:recombinase family protein n=1 Tax=Streptomyces sp. NPDC058989 TaxID=3346686 RepID=UPI0036B85BC2
MIERPYDGCGKCLVGLRRLSRKTDATSSPESQRDNVLAAVEQHGGHIIAWADDWDVSGGTDPLTRPAFGPWLRGERGPYDGVAGAAVDRIGRTVVDCLNTGYMMRDQGLTLLTYGHEGPWDLDDPNDENRFTMEAWGAQFELRAIQRRNRGQAIKARNAGRPHGKPSYGYEYVRPSPTAKVDHVRLSPESAENRRNIAKRVLADPENVSPWSEAARLTREGVLSPSDYLRWLYGKEPLGGRWYGSTVAKLLTSKVALGFLMHKGEPVIGDDGHPVRLPGADGQPVEQLWDYPTHLKLKEILERRAQPGKRRPKGNRILSARAICGICHNFMEVSWGGKGERGDKRRTYTCRARSNGIPGAEHCRPSPTITASILEEVVAHCFLVNWGEAQFMETVYYPGNGIPERIAEVEASRQRMRADREAGIYDNDEDAAWFRERYASMTAEIAMLKAEPLRPPGMITRPTGETVEDRWTNAPDDAARRELLGEFRVMATVWPEGAPRRWHVGMMHGPDRASWCVA